MKLRTKVFLAFSTLAACCLVVLTIFSYQRYTQTIYQRMDDISSRLFENSQETTNKTLDSIRQTTNFFNFYYNDGTSIIQDFRRYNDPEDRPDTYDFYLSSRNFSRICQSLLFQNEYIYGIYIFTPSGYIFNYTNGQNGTVLNSYEFQQDSWYQETVDLNGQFYISTVDKHGIFTGDRRTVFFSQYLKDVYTHDPLGVLMIDCDPDIFDLSAINTMSDITLLTIDNTMTNDVLYTNYDEIDRSFSEKTRNVMRENLNLSPLRLTMVVDYDSLFREFNVTGMLMILVSAVCIISFMICAYFVSQSLVKPIEHLSRKMASQKGHALISSTRHLDRTDEIGTLYNEYNAMVESLNSAIKQDYEDKLVILDAQMKSLEARINSHFLFNTLESINSMAELDDNEQIATMSLALGNMFRYTLKTQSELVTVEQELEHVQDYVSIQQIRFSYRFSLNVDMSEEFRQQKVLKLILQPLVENALYHGLEYCTKGDAISITGFTMDNFIYIDVHDNGVGMDSDTLENIRKSLNEEASFTELGHRNKQSIGLKNIHSRIELYYGRGYGLTITSSPGEWTNIRIKLPIVKQEEKIDAAGTSGKEKSCTLM